MMSEEQKRLHAIIRGNVQGVSLRYFSTKKAREIGITGWIQNLVDDNVELTAEGTQSQLDTFNDWLQTGSPDARVDSVTVDWSAATGEFDKFRIKHHLS
jgi:acylphosphatase